MGKERSAAIHRPRSRGAVALWFAGFVFAVICWLFAFAFFAGSSMNDGRVHPIGIGFVVIATFVSGLLWGNRNMLRHGQWPSYDEVDLTPQFPTRLKPAEDSHPARWLTEALTTFGENVGSIVPAGSEAYARVFHPAWKGGEDGHEVTWSEIARSTGRTFYPAAQWPGLAFTEEVRNINHLQDPPPGAPWDSPPEEGSLDKDVAEVLGRILERHTGTPDRCWFAFWEGWGGLRSDMAEAPRLLLPSRGYRLMTGRVTDITETAYPETWDYQSASLWWPDDRAWCVATEVDFETTYIGGTRACIDAVLAEPRLESLEVALDQGITWDSDTVNPRTLRLD